MAVNLTSTGSPPVPAPEPTRARFPGFRAWVLGSFALDTRSLALFRIALALIVLTDLGIRATELDAFYTDDGIVPRSRLAGGGGGSFHTLAGSERFEAAVFAVHGLFALAMLVGFRTQLATFGTCLLLHSLFLRNPHILQGGDSLLRLLLFWGIFLPLGARWSMDAARSADAPSRKAFSVPTVALVLQLCFLYWFSVALKTDSSWHEDGTAVYYALNIDQLVKPAGRALLEFPELMRVMTHTTYWLEVLGPLALFAPMFRWQTRLATVAAFLVFHLIGLNLCMELGPFPYVCAAAWMAMIPTEFWDRALQFAPHPSQIGSGVLGATPWVNVIAGILLAYVFLWNLRASNPERMGRILPQSWNTIGFGLGLDQYWAMFSPHPPKDDGWFVCTATIHNGEEVDLLREGQPVDWSKPERVSALYPNERWRKYMMNLPRGGQEQNRVHLIRYLWDRWNASQPPDRQLRDVKLYYVLEMTPPPSHTGPIPTERLLLGSCSTKSNTITLPVPTGGSFVP